MTTKIITGSFYDVLEQSYCMTDLIKGQPEDFTYLAALKIILADLNRSAFFDTNSRTFADLIRYWVSSNVSTDYTQGNINAEVFQLVIKHWSLLQNDEQLKQNCSDETQMVSVGFAYFDDDNVPCAVMFYGARFDPNIWTAAIIRNATSDPSERQVMLIGSDYLTKPDAIIDDNPLTFHDFLNSTSVSHALETVFLDNNQLDIKRLDALKKTLIHPTPAQKAFFIKKKQQLGALNDKELKKIDKNYYQNNNNRLETQIQQLNGSRSFVSRQSISFVGAIATSGITIALLLAITGALAPLGIVFAASAVTYGVIIAVAFSLVAISFVAKIITSERSLFEARQNLAKNNDQEQMLGKLIKEFQEKHGDLVSPEDKKEALASFIMVHNLGLDKNAFSLFCQSCLEKNATLSDDVDNSASLTEDNRAPSTTKLPDWHAIPSASPDHKHGFGLFDQSIAIQSPKKSHSEPDFDIIDELAPEPREMSHPPH